MLYNPNIANDLLNLSMINTLFFILFSLLPIIGYKFYNTGILLLFLILIIISFYQNIVLLKIRNNQFLKHISPLHIFSVIFIGVIGYQSIEIKQSLEAFYKYLAYYVLGVWLCYILVVNKQIDNKDCDNFENITVLGIKLFYFSTFASIFFTLIDLFYVYYETYLSQNAEINPLLYKISLPSYLLFGIDDKNIVSLNVGNWWLVICVGILNLIYINYDLFKTKKWLKLLILINILTFMMVVLGDGKMAAVLYVLILTMCMFYKQISESFLRLFLIIMLFGSIVLSYASYVYYEKYVMLDNINYKQKNIGNYYDTICYENVEICENVTKNRIKGFDNADYARIDLWGQAMVLFMENPYLGTGANTNRSLNVNIDDRRPYSYAENFALQVLVESGIIGFITMSLMFIFFIKRLNKQQLYIFCCITVVHVFGFDIYNFSVITGWLLIFVALKLFNKIYYANSV